MIKRFFRLFLSEITVIKNIEMPEREKKGITKEDIKRKQKEIFSYKFWPTA